ncbi:MAG: DNA polymerase III subunit delta [Coriobacteriia bacterium]
MAKQLVEYKSVYLIVGEQDLLLNSALEALKASVAEVADLDFNLETFEGESADVDDVVAACNTLPFVSERRLVIVRGVDKMPKDGTDALVRYAEDPSPTTILALVAKKLAKNTRLFKIVDKLGGVIERKNPEPREFPRLVQDMFTRAGKRISLEGAEYLVGAVGRDLQRLSVEVGKTVSYVGDRVEVGLSDAEEVASTTAKTSVFELGTALGNRDCAAALRLLNRLLGDGESVFGLHALALRQLRDLLSARALIDRGTGSQDDLARALGRPAWQMRNLAGQAKRFSAGELVVLLQAAAASEAEMKTSRDPRLAFERWIVKVCG